MQLVRRKPATARARSRAPVVAGTFRGEHRGLNMPEPVAPKRKYTRKAAEPTPVPRTRGQALPPEVRNKVWNDRMVLGMTVNATAIVRHPSLANIERWTSNSKNKREKPNEWRSRELPS